MIVLNVNGQTHQIEAEPETPLLWIIRENLGLSGTKYSCGLGLCGACTIHIDGVAARACQTPLRTILGTEITTIEGLTSPIGQALKKAWVQWDVPQCGFCQPGQIMAASALLAANPDPGDSEIIQTMSGNICRCGTYNRIFNAIKTAISTT